MILSHLFCYGTLLAKEVRDKVLQCDTNKLMIKKGFIEGFEVRRVKDTNYPMLVKSKKKLIVNGEILLNLSKEDFRKLDSFEGENYKKKVLNVITNDSNLKCNVYVAITKLKFEEIWNFDSWYKYDINKFFLEDFNRSGVKKPKT